MARSGVRQAGTGRVQGVYSGRSKLAILPQHLAHCELKAPSGIGNASHANLKAQGHSANIFCRTLKSQSGLAGIPDATLKSLIWIAGIPDATLKALIGIMGVRCFDLKAPSHIMGVSDVNVKAPSRINESRGDSLKAPSRVADIQDGMLKARLLAKYVHHATWKPPSRTRGVLGASLNIATRPHYGVSADVGRQVAGRWSPRTNRFDFIPFPLL